MPGKPRSRPDAAAARAALESHVVDVQRTIRTCDDCGLCCTAAHNSVTILPIEAKRIAIHLATLAPTRQRALDQRIDGAIRKFGLAAAQGKPLYTCPFLEPDLRCALPLDVKPVACLAFNPLTPDACDMEADRFHRAHDPVAAQNAARGLAHSKAPIPVAVRDARRTNPRG